MYCPYCKSQESKVIDKRNNLETNTIRRRRECLSCKKRFTSYERIETVIKNVLKRNGLIEEFNREKIKFGILKAVKKRNLGEEVINQIIDNVENKVLNKDVDIIKSKEIGQIVLEELSRVDELGALLFASVYKEFQSLEDVQNEIKKLSKQSS